MANAIALFEIIDDLRTAQRARGQGRGRRMRGMKAGMDRRQAQYALSVFSSLNGVSARM